MNKEWSELNKAMQMQIKNKNSFHDGIMTLLLLREKLTEQIAEFENTRSAKGFRINFQTPFNPGIFAISIRLIFILVPHKNTRLEQLLQPGVFFLL